MTTQVRERALAYELPRYPAGLCTKCHKDAWGIWPDGSHYYCTNCIAENEVERRFLRLPPGGVSGRVSYYKDIVAKTATRVSK